MVGSGQVQELHLSCRVLRRLRGPQILRVIRLIQPLLFSWLTGFRFRYLLKVVGAAVAA